MPILGPEDLERAVKDGRINAISIDTSVFDQFDCNLQYATLTALERYPKAGIQVVLADVILTEVRSHIETDLVAAREKARAGLNQYGKAWKLSLSANEISERLGAPASAAEHARQLVDEFTSRVSAVVLAADDYVKTGDVLKAWTLGSPPFGARDKKNEFPDAFALMALECWARQRQTMVLAISRDDDWAEFAELSEHVVTAKNLKAALDLFNVADRAAALEIVEALKATGEAAAPRAAIDLALELYLEEYEADASSYYYFEIENGPAVAVDWSVADNSEVRVLAVSDEKMTISFHIDAVIEFEISVELSKRDGIDHDYVNLGYHRFETQKRRTLPVTLIIYKEDGVMSIEDAEAEIADRPLIVSFGDLEPDWGYEE